VVDFSPAALEEDDVGDVREDAFPDGKAADHGLEAGYGGFGNSHAGEEAVFLGVAPGPLDQEGSVSGFGELAASEEGAGGGLNISDGADETVDLLGDVFAEGSLDGYGSCCNSGLGVDDCCTVVGENHQINPFMGHGTKVMCSICSLNHNSSLSYVREVKKARTRRGLTLSLEEATSNLEHRYVRAPTTNSLSNT
jgi:hypothetical protein